MMVSQTEKAANFLGVLHEGPRAFVIANLWDAGSAPLRSERIYELKVC